MTGCPRLSIHMGGFGCLIGTGGWRGSREWWAYEPRRKGCGTGTRYRAARRHFAEHDQYDRCGTVRYAAVDHSGHARTPSHSGLGAGSVAGRMRWTGVGRTGRSHAQGWRILRVPADYLWTPPRGKISFVPVYL